MRIDSFWDFQILLWMTRLSESVLCSSDSTIRDVLRLSEIFVSKIIPKHSRVSETSLDGFVF